MCGSVFSNDVIFETQNESSSLMSKAIHSHFSETLIKNYGEKPQNPLNSSLTFSGNQFLNSTSSSHMIHLSSSFQGNLHISNNTFSDLKSAPNLIFIDTKSPITLKNNFFQGNQISKSLIDVKSNNISVVGNKFFKDDS